MMEFFNNYFAKVRFSQVMGIDILKTQDIFDYLNNEFEIMGVTDEREVEPKEIEEAFDEGYEEGWRDAVDEMEMSMPSKYGYSNRSRR